MLDTNHKTLHSHPSLLPLRAALIAAERESPASPPRVDPNEQRALQLISKMKKEFNKSSAFTSWKDNETLRSFNLQEVIGSNV
ncbi:MAG TPA: hypothetical protein VLA72_14205 [Anaerolineales bacterium]|nr:hypothetical protein [Anaerolineales bacterium]